MILRTVFFVLLAAIVSLNASAGLFDRSPEANSTVAEQKQEAVQEEESFPVADPDEEMAVPAETSSAPSKSNAVPGEAKEATLPLEEQEKELHEFLTQPPKEPNAPLGHYFTQGVARMNVLDKVAARAFVVEPKLGQAFAIGTLSVTVKACINDAVTAGADKALVEVWEQKPLETNKKIFHGWMFSKDYAQLGVEHPFYDFRLLSCKKF